MDFYSGVYFGYYNNEINSLTVAGLTTFGGGIHSTRGNRDNIQFNGGLDLKAGAILFSGNLGVATNLGFTTKSLKGEADTIVEGSYGGSGTSTVVINGNNGATTTFAGSVKDYHEGSGGTSVVSIIKSGNSTQVFSGTNTYSGDTTVSAGTLELSPTGSLRFVIGGNGTNNALKGAGSTVIDGQFAFDLTGASTSTNATWTIVANTLTNSYGTNFIVTGFSGAGGNWTNTTNGVNYVFAQSNSVLSVQSTGSVTPYNAWVAYWQGVNPGFTDTAGTANPDGDPFNNNLEFAFDGNPTIGTGALLTATKVGTNAVFNYVAQTNTNAVTYQVQNTINLSAGPWSNSVVTISNSANQSGISQTNDYVRKEFVVPATNSDFYRVRATIAP
jgi:autotransporter-associated beta strand protein